MENYVIQPWDSNNPQIGINSDTWVPSEIEKLSHQVITCYNMKVRTKTLISSNPDIGRAIWKIETDIGPRCLKILHRQPIKSLFSVGAQDYVVKRGGRVPEINKTKEGFLYVEKGGKLWIVTDWIETLTPANKDLEGALALCYGLGEFHRHSRGYTPPLGSQKNSRLYHWPSYYQGIIEKISWFRNVAEASNDILSSLTFLRSLDIFKQQALNTLSFLEQSSYEQMASLGEAHWGLVHQDFGWSSGQLSPDGLWVINLDGVAYDLPIRDLRKLISETMDYLGKWDITWIREMIAAYHQANPLDLQTYEILVNDLKFPNEFCAHIYEMLYDPFGIINNDVEQIIQHLTLLEKTKELTLIELQLDKIKFQTGNYVSEPDIDQVTLSIEDRCLPKSGQPCSTTKTKIEHEISLSEFNNDLTNNKTPDKTIGDRSSIIKVTPDMIDSMWMNNNPTNLIPPSIANSLIFPIKVNIEVPDINNSSVMKVTQQMIR